MHSYTDQQQTFHFNFCVFIIYISTICVLHILHRVTGSLEIISGDSGHQQGTHWTGCQLTAHTHKHIHTLGTIQRCQSASRGLCFWKVRSCSDASPFDHQRAIWRVYFFSYVYVLSHGPLFMPPTHTHKHTFSLPNLLCSHLLHSPVTHFPLISFPIYTCHFLLLSFSLLFLFVLCCSACFPVCYFVYL